MKHIKAVLGITAGLSIFLLLGAATITDASFTFKNIYTDSNTNRIIYISDNEGNRVPDFSYSGYKNSNQALPDSSTLPRFTVNCTAADCTQIIQDGINTVATWNLVNGFRGVVYLPAGTYNITNGLNVNATGVVLVGAGSGQLPANNTIINVSAPSASAYVITLGNANATSGWPNTSGTQAYIDNNIIPVGATEFRIQGSGYVPMVDEEIVFVHPTTNAWVQQINYGGVAAPGWLDESLPDILYKRKVKSVVQVNNLYNVSIDAPLLTSMDKSVSGSYIYPFNSTSAGYTNNVGLENIRVNIGTSNGVTPYILNGVFLYNTSDSWVQNVVVNGYQNNGFNTQSADRLTIKNSQALAPIGTTNSSGGFAFRSSSNTNSFLCDGCVADGAQHSFVTNFFGSGNVYVRSSATHANSSSEAHQKWSSGNLFDTVTISSTNAANTAAAFGNRGIYGTNQGWSAAHSVMWNVKAGASDYIITEKPPTAQNYCYNCSAGTVTGVGYQSNSFQGSPGYIENKTQVLASLFDTQLAERLAAGANGPSAPANFKTAVNNANVSLSWDNLAIGAQSIVIERSTNGGASFSQLATVGPNTTSYIDNTGSIINAPNYQYRVYALKNINGKIARSATSNTSPIVARYVKIALEAPMSTTSTVRLNELQVYNASNINVAKGKTVTTNSGTNAKPLVDNSTTSYWQSTVPQPGTSWNPAIYAYVNLGSVYGVKQIKLYQGSNYYPVEYYLYVSPDAVNWTQVRGVVTGTGGTVTYNF